MVEVAGIDGYRRGWVAVVLVDGRFERAIVAKRLADLAERLDASEIIGVDIPIGLPESGARAADLEAARFVGPRRSSVFPTPPRAVWEAADIDTARRLSIALTGKSIASQTFALRERVLEADVVAKSDSRIREVHPEVSFRAIAGRSLMAPKASWAGLALRRGLLVGVGIELPDDLGEAGVAGFDDVLDAAAAAWSAHRVAKGEASSLPAEPIVGLDGLTPAIWY